MKIFSRSLRLTIAGISLLAMDAQAEIPDGYYSSCENKSGTTLLNALYSTINNHTVVSYDGLWSLYHTSDVRDNGTIWDMYSTKEWKPDANKCGNYSKVGDCYNREHSMPKSWFKDATPMYSDAFHLYPTDGKVNGQRGNYPFGECSGGTTLASNGSVKALGRLGKSTYPGYSGTVFEPDDEYKGDFARSYFYMAACYNDRIANWSSDMLSGDKNTPFKSWAMEMLLKWHRQDPVSEKELKRNEAVYAAQHNRNPFIDHPELAEYIWGNNQGQKWTNGAPSEPAINQPQSGTQINLGITRPGVAVTRSINVRTSDATENVSVAVIGGGFSVNPTSIAANTANSGTTVTLTYAPTAIGEHAATLRVTNGNAISTVTIHGRAVDGLPVGPTTDVTDESFTAIWTYIGDADAQGNYTLTVSDEQGNLDGYPKAVNAQAGQYEVTGLMAETRYYYTVASTKETSEKVEVITAEPLPLIDFLFDGTLAFETSPGQPSEVAEIMIDTDNIFGDFTVTVSEPFQISLDKNNWHTQLTMSPDQDRLYMRLFAEDAGEYATSITARYGTYENDDAMANGIVTIASGFFEDFEKSQKGNYTNGDYEGTACTWYMNNAGVYDNNSEPAVSGQRSVRFGKNDNSYIEMKSDLTSGIGTISFQAAKWADDADAELAVETSSDGGATYKTAGTVKITDNAFKPFNVFAGVSGKARVKLRQTAGSRLNIDDIVISAHTSGCEYLEADYHAWDAYCLDGKLVIEVKRPAGLFAVYSLEGLTVVESALGEGLHTFNLPAGLYIIANGEDARRVVVRQ